MTVFNIHFFFVIFWNIQRTLKNVRHLLTTTEGGHNEPSICSVGPTPTRPREIKIEKYIQITLAPTSMQLNTFI